MKPRMLCLTALPGIPLVQAGDDIGALIAASVRRLQLELADRDVVVVAQKLVSKAEGQTVALAGIVPGERARALAQVVGKDARLVEVILGESAEVVRYGPGVLITAHRLGFVMANAGVDQSNVGPVGEERVLLLPRVPDASAAALKAQLDDEFGVDLGVVVSDSSGRAWRNGVVGVAIGAAGVPALWSRIGAPDLFGRTLRGTEIAVVDELASAAALLMGESDEAVPVVHVRGVVCDAEPLPASALVRSRETDLFR